jgi:Tol biopolymer transport system component
VVTLDPGLLTPLPPTFTPTATLEPSETPTPTETPFPLNSFTIIYSDFEPAAAQPSLYQGSADGTGEIKLQAGDTGGFNDVALDDSGEQIAFVRFVSGEDGTELPQLFAVPIGGLDTPTKLTSMTGSALAHPDWSPDGTRIVFSSNEDGDEEIWVISADGTNPIQLTGNELRDFDPEFSPDGRSIIFASEADSPGFTKIYVMNANGGEARLLNDLPVSYSPTWSPDGSRVAFVSSGSGDGDIYVMDADGQRVFLLTVDDNGAEDRTPKWSPDGRWILFASNREGDGAQFRWYAVNLDGTIQPVTQNDRNPQSLSFLTG